MQAQRFVADSSALGDLPGFLTKIEAACVRAGQAAAAEHCLDMLNRSRVDLGKTQKTL